MLTPETKSFWKYKSEYSWNSFKKSILHYSHIYLSSKLKSNLDAWRLV